MIGKHGLDERNEAGEQLMQVCALNELTVMNTWFEKKRVQYGTWMHPRTKVSHMIDLVVLRAGQRMCCRDVQAMRGASCWTDHNLVRAKLRIDLPRVVAREKTAIPLSIHKFTAPAARDEYRNELERVLEEYPFDEDLSIEESWQVLKSSTVSAAEKTIGRGRKKQPEWFEENEGELEQLIEAKNKARVKMLRCNSVAARKEFRQQQRIVKMAVDKAKEEWINRVSLECEAAVKDGKARWDSIRKLQQAHGGRRPLRLSAVMKDNGELIRDSVDFR